MSGAVATADKRGVKPRLPAAAGLALALFGMGSLVLLLGGNGRAAVAHTCSATDRQFMSVAQLNMAALGSLSEDYHQGDAQPAGALEQPQTASVRLRHADPRAPAASRTRAHRPDAVVSDHRAV